MEGKSDNNKVMLAGKIVAHLEFQMEHKGEAFYRTILQVNRQSGQCDLIPLLLSERLLDDTQGNGDVGNEKCKLLSESERI